MADRLLIFKNALFGQFPQSLNAQRGASEAPTSALAQNMTLLTGGQRRLQQEMGQVKQDVLCSLEFSEKQQMRGEEAWIAVYGEVSSLSTRKSRREQAPDPPQKDLDIGPSIPFEGRTRAIPKSGTMHWGTSAPEFYPNIPQEKAPPRFLITMTLGGMARPANPHLVRIDRKLTPDR